MSSQSLVVTCIGPDRPGLVGDLTRVVATRSANLEDSRMAILGGEFAIIMLVAVAPEQRAALEADLEAHAASTGLALGIRTTATRPALSPGRSYRVRADTMDHPGIVQQVADFFATRGINITDLETSVWPAPHTGTPMFTLDMQIVVPASVGTRALREAFAGFCADTDLDATLEPSGP